MHPYVGGYWYTGEGFDLKASNTGAFSGEEVTLLSTSGIDWSGGGWLSWEFTNSTSYRYYRIYVTECGAFGCSFGPIIEEVEMMECISAGSSTTSSSTSSTTNS